jgi:radical SAM protein with 4Fe4S-binding SPASM domain
MISKSFMNIFLHKCLLLTSLFNRRRALTGPLFVDLDITDRCNINCPGCRYHSALLPKSDTKMPPPGDMDYDLILRIFNELVSINTKEIFVLGSGEPLLSKKFIDIVREGKARRFKMTVITNGTLLTDRMAEDLVASGLDQIKISLWAADAEEYRKIHPGTPPFLFDRILNGIQWLQKRKRGNECRKPAVMIHCPLYQGNIDKLEEMVDRSIEYGVDGLSIAPVYDSFDGARPLTLNSRQQSELSGKLNALSQKLDRAGMKHNMAEMRIRLQFGHAPWQAMPCYIGLYHAKIRTDGKVYPCCRCKIAMGDLTKNTFQEIWNSEAYRLFRQNALNAEGRNPFSDRCNCSFCSFTQNNYKIFQYDRFISPIARHLSRQ